MQASVAVHLPPQTGVTTSHQPHHELPAGFLPHMAQKPEAHAWSVTHGAPRGARPGPTHRPGTLHGPASGVAHAARLAGSNDTSGLFAIISHERVILWMHWSGSSQGTE